MPDAGNCGNRPRPRRRMGRLGGGQVAVVRKRAAAAAAIAVVSGALARLHLDGHVVGAVVVATHAMAATGRGRTGRVWRMSSKGWDRWWE